METYIAQFRPFIKAKHKRYFFWNHRQVYVYILTKLNHMIVTNSSCLKRGVLVYQKSFLTRNWSCKRLDFVHFYLLVFTSISKCGMYYPLVQPSGNFIVSKYNWNKEYLQHFLFMIFLQYRNLILSSFLVLRSFYS